MMIKCLTFLLGILMMPTVFASGAQFMTVVGEVTLMRNRQSIAVKSGDTVDGAFTITTADQSQTQVRLEDGTLLTVLRNSEVQLPASHTDAINLQYGGMDLMSGKDYRIIMSNGSTMKTNGFLKLRLCGEGCKEPRGLYGRTLSGEVIVEYAGGRSVLRNKPFRISSESLRPTLLAREPELFIENLPFERAAKAKIALAEQLKSGMEAFKAGQYDKARETLQSVVEQSPAESIVSYYLGLIALELKDNDTALRHLKQYARDDSEGAQKRGVNQLLTLLITNQLQNEVQQAIQQENKLSNHPPEPND